MTLLKNESFLLSGRIEHSCLSAKMNPKGRRRSRYPRWLFMVFSILYRNKHHFGVLFCQARLCFATLLFFSVWKWKTQVFIWNSVQDISAVLMCWHSETIYIQVKTLSPLKNLWRSGWSDKYLQSVICLNFKRGKIIWKVDNCVFMKAETE